MGVYLYYVDESYDASKFCLSALMIRHREWKQCFDAVRAHRVKLKTDHGVYLRKEIHARDLVSGHGNISSTGAIGKFDRSRIFLGLLELVARLPGMRLFNICLDNKGQDPQLTAWNRLVNRIERTMVEFENKEGRIRARLAQAARPHLPVDDADALELRLKTFHPRSIIIADEGREAEITKALRKMHVYNPVPSRFGVWQSGEPAKNIVTERLIEDPVFKKSHQSYFLQLADCVAFALLKREVPPTPNVLRYNLHQMFEAALKGVCFLPASRSDPLGIVRG